MIYLLKSLFDQERHKGVNNNEIGREAEEVALAYFKVRSRNSPGGAMLCTSIQRHYGTLRPV